MPNARNGLSEKQQTQATNKGREELQKKKKNLWYELIQYNIKHSNRTPETLPILRRKIRVNANR